MLFEKRITITFTDFIAFNKVHIGHRFWINPVWIWTAIAVFSVLVFAIGVSGDAEVRGRGIPFLVFLFVFIYTLFAAGIWLFWWILKGLNRLLLYAGYKSNPHIFIDVQALIDERGIEYQTCKENYVSLWQQVVKVHDDGLRYFIYYGVNAVFILPKRYFDSLDELDRFTKFLKAYTNPDLKYEGE